MAVDQQYSLVHTKMQNDTKMKQTKELTQLLYVWMQRYFFTPNPLSTFHPFLPPYRLPEGTFRVQPRSMTARGKTPILHKDSNPQQKGRQQNIGKPDKQKDREKKKRYDERPRRSPTPSFTPPSACRWNDRNKEEVKQGAEQRTEEEKWKDRSWLLQNKPPPCLWLASCHCDIFLPSLSHSTDTQMNQPWHRLMALCHLCIVSPFISAPYNISYKDTHKASAQQSCGPRTFDQMTVKCSNTNPMLTTSSNSQSCSSTRDHCLSIHTETPTHLHTILQSLISLPVQVVSCVVCVRVRVHTGAGGEVPPLHWRSPRPPFLIRPSCSHPKPIKSH